MLKKTSQIDCRKKVEKENFNISRELTAEDFKNYSFPSRHWTFIQRYLNMATKKENDLKILDWGCGQGKDVYFLKKKGFLAYGADIDIKRMRSAKRFYANHNLNFQQSLVPIDLGTGKVPFQDGTFDMIMSNQIFEHANDIQKVIRELYRISASGGWGFHNFPGPLRIIEPHLLMPFVHWFPKNWLRKYFIKFFVQIGIEPKWPHLQELTKAEKAHLYFIYSIKYTQYRSYKQVARIFQEQGFTITAACLDHPKIKSIPFMDVFLKAKLFRIIM